jgi:TolA-binding protein
MDVDSIEPGLDFARVLNDQVAQCDILISVVGKNWIDARDENGARRLDNPDDFVRIEIEAALHQDKRVIPVLVGEAQMPRADQLPDTLRPFARRNAVRLTHERFRADTQALITTLQRALKTAEDTRSAQVQEASARQRAEDERKRAETEAKRRAAEREAEARAHAERRQREAKADRQQAERDEAYKVAMAGGDAAGFRTFLDRYPNDKRAREVRRGFAALNTHDGGGSR